MTNVARRSNLEERLGDPIHSVLETMQRRMIEKSTWFGVRAWQNPLDAWVYQEIIFAQQPDWIVEVGVNAGGSTLMLAHLCDLIGAGQVVGVELDPDRIDPRVSAHERVTILEGPALDRVHDVSALVADAERTLVIEDSSHTYQHTLDVCRAYGPLVHIGGHLVVEDGICHHGLDVGPDPGPFEATRAFVEEDARFEIDRGFEDFGITWNPGGFLRRLS